MLQGLKAGVENCHNIGETAHFSEKISCPLENVYPIPGELFERYAVAKLVTGTAENKKSYERLQVDITLNFRPPRSPNEVIMGLLALKTAGALMLTGGIQEAILLPYWGTMIRCIIVKGQFMYPPSTVPRHAGGIVKYV